MRLWQQIGKIGKKRAALFMVLSLAGCGPAVVEDGDNAQANEAVVQPVKLLTVGANADARLRDFPAVVEAAQVAQLGFRVGGEISSFPVKAGNEVQQGDLIAKLDPTDYQLVVDQAQARFQLAQTQFDRTESLAAQGVISQQQFDEVRANLQVTRANLETAKANLRYTELRAPFAGSIAHVFVEAFETVQPQQPIATLQMDDAIDISINVPEQLFARVQRSTDYQPDVSFAANPEQRYPITLKEWDTTADPATNTYKVVFTMPKPQDLNLLPGMSATVHVDTQAVANKPQVGISVPTSAVFSEPTEAAAAKPRVWVYDPQSQQVQQREVTTGMVTGDAIEITAGLQTGEQIVVAGVHALSEGQKVRPWVKERGL